MLKKIDKKLYWVACKNCKGLGKKKQRPTKKARQKNKKINCDEKSQTRQKNQLQSCLKCKGSGLILSGKQTTEDHQKYPHIAIIGAGIGGVALAVACLHRGIPFTLFEKDTSFSQRSQGYGLTLQQASKAMTALGITKLEEGITSTKHIVFTSKGKIIGEWGIRKWGRANAKKAPKRKNIHIARQSLRLALLDQLNGHDSVKWGHQLLEIKGSSNENIELKFKVNNQVKTTKANLVVGADGIRSTVRKIIIGGKKTPLQYLDCMVILGICPLENVKDLKSDLLDSETVFQTANGNERIYMMPYNSSSIMWQLSFPTSEKIAIELNKLGSKALKEVAIKRTHWHTPIPEIIAATLKNQISGYPVYDRELLKPEFLNKVANITLIGDAAHPMSPFKGQGANQALLDALSLVKTVSKNYNAASQFKDIGVKKNILTDFESEMINRSSSKVKGSAEAAKLLHSKIILKEGNAPRGKHQN
ncbi:NAD(P)/FAD-dependent oxidoreductase [uncultured Polaribacter sp.]|uniref:FAD-dependent monooxygenase n=1 Tax=uncultured Polaribacter sp. TaxID=174711 RepID=UPI00261AC816|nr:NAD(P)/FAD-dependent oxidoreductase [uncultured Polaribacter sp.]